MGLAGWFNLLETTPADASFSTPCSSGGSWRPGELNVYWFDVEQGDSQLIVGPTGRTLLIDLGETAWDTTGTSTNAHRVAEQIRAICGVRTRVHLDYVMASHHHLDHTGFASNPNDLTGVGNGLYQLLSPAGENFSVGILLDRDAGVWRDANGDGDCDVSNTGNPGDEIEWHNAGTISPAALRWICWLYGPKEQRDRTNIAGHVTTVRNSDPWPEIDLGPGVEAKIVQANGKGLHQADGTPVSGDHTRDRIPAGENDYTTALKFTFGLFEYATAGDANGEFAATDLPEQIYTDMEASLSASFGNVETIRANHHGSSHSNSSHYVSALAPETAFISCGSNGYGHPGNRVLDAFRRVGADIYLSNRPCATEDADGSRINYEGTLGAGGDVHLATTGAGTGYTVTYDGGSRAYRAFDETAAPPPERPQLLINEYLVTPLKGGSEWVELYNASPGPIDAGGLAIDDRPGGGAPPHPLPADSVIAPGGRLVVTLPERFLADTGTDSVRLVGPDENIALDAHIYALESVNRGMVLHRMGDAGSWCATASRLATPGGTNQTGCP